MLSSRKRSPSDTCTQVPLGPACAIGSKEHIVVMAGPCSIESEAQLNATAELVQSEGVGVLRAGAFKSRTSPYGFQGLGEQGVELLKAAAQKHNLKIVSEAVSPQQVELLAACCDVIQIGARNMQNYELLRTAGKCGKPVLLKRGLAASLKEFLLAAERLLTTGNENVILCERGIRTFEREVRFTLALGSIPPLREQTHLPIIVDPSHAAGKAAWVPDYVRAAIAMGCDGLLMEVHANPKEALCDGSQSMGPELFKTCMKDIRRLAKAMGKSVL